MWFRNFFKDKPDQATQPVGRQKSATSASIALSGQTVRLLDRLQLNAGPLSPTASGGLRASPNRKPAYEFRDHRQYAPGDDVRYVDWKASARQEHVYIKQGEEQKGAAVYVLIDCSASMAWGDPAKSGAALTLAHALGYLALAHSDRLVILPVSDGGDAGPGVMHPLGPLWGKGQAPMLESYLKALRFRGRVDLAGTLVSLPQRNLSRSGLVFVISDLLGTSDFTAALGKLPSPGWQVVFCHLLHPAELEPRLNGPLEMLDVETGGKKRYTIDAKALETYRQRLDAWREDLAGRCRSSRAVYCMLPTDASMESDIIPRLRRERVVIPWR
jgi:uncharacterized protein (DUF58 family)